MKYPLRAFGAVAVTVSVLAGCVETGATGYDTTLAERACLSAVAQAANNPDVELVGSQFSQAGTSVQVLVDGRATWSCIGYADGSTAGVQFDGEG